MESIMRNIHQANAKALLLSRVNFVFIFLNVVSMIMLIATWSVSISKEGAGVSARYASCIIAFILLAVATFLSVLVYRLQPRLSLYYGHQAVSIVTLLLAAISMGMNSVVVDLCGTRRQLPNTQCGAHVGELVAEVLVCVSMGFNYASTQQRIVTFIDNGILDGIKGRSGNMTQLP